MLEYYTSKHLRVRSTVHLVALSPETQLQFNQILTSTGLQLLTVTIFYKKMASELLQKDSLVVHFQLSVAYFNKATDVTIANVGWSPTSFGDATTTAKYSYKKRWQESK